MCWQPYPTHTASQQYSGNTQIVAAGSMQQDANLLFLTANKTTTPALSLTHASQACGPQNKAHSQKASKVSSPQVSSFHPNLQLS